MTIRAMNWAWDINLQPTLKLVLLKLADRANDDGECWPGQASIAQACGVSERTLIRHVATLEQMGLLEKQSRYGEDGKRSTNIYRLDLDGSLSAKLAHGLSDNLSHGLSDKSCTNHVTTVSLTLNEEPTVLNHMHAPACARNPDPIATDPIRFDGVRWFIDDAVFDGWLIAYQAGRTHQDTEDWIEAELAKASTWLQANPRKRKKNYLRFMSGWLTRASQANPYRKQQQPRPYH